MSLLQLREKVREENFYSLRGSSCPSLGMSFLLGMKEAVCHQNPLLSLIYHELCHHSPWSPRNLL